jgi:hypothetical protein
MRGDGEGTGWALSDLGAVSTRSSALLRRPTPRHHARQKRWRRQGCSGQDVVRALQGWADEKGVGSQSVWGEHCHSVFCRNRGGAVEMAMVISLSHQARMACYHGGSHKNGFAKRDAEQAAAAGRQHSDRQLLAVVRYPRHPGTPAIACSFASFTPGPAVSSVLDVIAISAPAVRRVLVVSAASSHAEVGKLHHPAPTHPVRCSCLAQRQIRDSRCGVGSSMGGGRLFNLTYVV